MSEPLDSSLERLVRQRGASVLSLTWSNHAGEGTDEVLFHNGKYYLVLEEALVGPFDDLDAVMNSEPAEALFVTEVTVSVDSGRLSFEDLLGYLRRDPWGDGHPSPGASFQINESTVYWNHGGNLCSSVDEIVPVCAADAGVADPGPPAIHEEAGGYWIWSEDEGTIAEPGYRSLFDARAGRGDHLHLADLERRKHESATDDTHLISLWFRWSAQEWNYRTGELWSGVPGQAELLVSRRFICSARHAASSLLDDYFALCLAKGLLDELTCVSGAAFDQSAVRRRIRAAQRQTSL